MARRIVEAVSPRESDIVVEIGPGTGALTGMLSEQAGHVVAVEIDPRLAAEIRATIVSNHLTLIEADALELDWASVLDHAVLAWRAGGARAGEPRLRVVANLPYYISTPILQTLLRHHDRFYDLTLMLQDEVVERIVSGPGHHDYGYLSLLVQYYCEAAKLFAVPPSAFRPAPKVRSAVVRLAIRPHPPVRVDDAGRFFALIRAAFAQRRKTIANNLKAAGEALGEAADPNAALAWAGLDPRRRAETLSLADFAGLYRALYDPPRGQG